MGLFGAPRDDSGIIAECTKCHERKTIYTRTGMCVSCAKEKTEIENTITTLRDYLKSAEKHSEASPDYKKIAKNLKEEIAELERKLSKFPTKDISPKPRF